MEYGLNSDGTGAIGLVLVLLFLMATSFFCGIILISASKGRTRMWGFYMVIAAIVMLIACILLYSAGNYDL
jgi:bacteriorhodopsin